MPDVRSAIYEFLMTRPNGATATEIEAAVKERLPRVGSSTVRGFLRRHSDLYGVVPGQPLERPERGRYRLPADVRAPKRVLITGLPATGKTTFGHYLAVAHGYVHVDFEHWPTLVYLDSDWPSRLEHLLSIAPRVVITWGFPPDSMLPFVLELRDVFGFRWVWCEGDRETAHRHYTERDTGTEEDWKRQLGKIDTFIEPRMDELLPQRIDVFDPSGVHRPSPEVWDEIVG